MKFWKRLGVVGAAAAMCIGVALGTAACGGRGGPNHFSIFIPSGESDEFYGVHYEKNPVVKYLESKTWNVDGEDVQLSFEWDIPASDPTGYLGTAINTMSYSDVMDVTSATSIMSVRSMYDVGMILDLTEYVDKYMPNYKAFLAAHPNLAKTATNVTDDGNKYLQIWAYQGDDERMWGGWLYRRDWLVKYGKNPSTGAAFTTQGWTEISKVGENDNWVDDVMFPSWYSLDAKGNPMKGPNGEEFKDWFNENVDANWTGNQPVTLSDWEWMLQIFENALQGEGISDGYPMGMYSPGYYETGDLVSAFGGGGPTWYLTENKSKANFGMTSDSFREYLKVMNSWYKEGWIHSTFHQSNKIFYEADTTEAGQGKVGLWWGMNAQMADKIAAGAGLDKANVCVYGARQPINTTYGTSDMKYKIPTLMYQTTQEMRSFVITNKAEGKNIAAFCTMMDFMYSDEGAVLQGFGMDKAHYEEYKENTGKTDSLYESFMDENGNVVYNDGTNADGSGWTTSNKISSDSQLDAIRGSRLWGYAPKWKIQSKDGFPKTTRVVQDEWVAYRATADISNSLLGQLSPAEGDEFALIKASLRNWAQQNVNAYVRGVTDPNVDANWTNFCRQLNNLKTTKGTKVSDGTKILQDLLNKMNG